MLGAFVGKGSSRISSPSPGSGEVASNHEDHANQEITIFQAATKVDKLTAKMNLCTHGKHIRSIHARSLDVPLGRRVF